MFQNDSIIDEAALLKEQQEEAAKLGMEARSILKSIRTEESKLLFSTNLTRSDRHYFRARSDYYRLSLKRLPTEERLYLEPVLARFNERITKLEIEDGITTPTKPIPFLAPVDKGEEVSQPGLPEIKSENRMSNPSANLMATAAHQQIVAETISQLSLVQMALSAEINADSRRILSDGIARVIQRLKSLN